MERDFEQIEVDCIPGAYFWGVVEFGVDGDSPCVERIYLQAWKGEPELLLDHRSTDFYAKLFRELSDALLAYFADDAWELVPRFDPKAEWGTHWSACK